MGVYSNTIFSAWSDNPEYRRPFNIPSPPDNSKLVLYGPLPKGILGEAGESSDDWKPILEKLGVKFPTGGFAIFYKPARVLIVATDAEDQELISVLCE